MSEKTFKNIEFYFEHKGRKYGGLYNLIYDSAEVLAAEIVDIWDFDTGVSVNIQPVSDENILLLSAADKIVYPLAVAKHKWILAPDWG